MYFRSRIRYIHVPLRNLYSLFSSLFSSKEKGELAEISHATVKKLSVCFSLDGAALGMFFYTSFVLSKGFNAPPLLVSLACMGLPAGLLLAFPVGYFFEGRKKNSLFLASASLSFIAAIGLFLFPSEQIINLTLPLVGSFSLPPGSLFLLWVPIYGIAEAIKYPARYSIFQTNFSYRERARFIGSLYVCFSIINLIVMIFAGRFLDSDYHLYKIVLPGAMLISSISSLVFYFVPALPAPMKKTNRFSLKTLHKPIVDFFRMTFEEKYFMGFELGFFLYGSGFMMVSAALPIFYTQELGAKYWQFGITGVIMNVVMLSSPLIGKWSDKTTPTKLAIIAFSMNGLFPIMLLFCGVPFHGYLAHIWFASAVSMDVMAWNIGPIFFSGKRDASKYIGVNATLTGIRAIVSFSIAGMIMEYTDSFVPIFVIASILFGAGAITMLIVHLRCIKKSKFLSTLSGRYNYSD